MMFTKTDNVEEPAQQQPAPGSSLSRASIASYQPSQRFLFFATFLTHVWHPNLSWIC
jgi:hypothetical protein